MNESLIEKEKKAQLDLFGHIPQKTQSFSKYTTPLESPEFYAHEADEHFYGFINNLHSKHSQAAYKIDLKQFLSFIRDYYKGKLTLPNVQKSHVLLFLNGKLENISKRSFNRKLTVISKYFDYLLELKLATENPCTFITRKAISKSVETKALEKDEIKLLINASKERPHPLHYALFTLLFSTGIRVGELCSLKIGDFKKHQGRNESEQYFYITYTAKGDLAMRKTIPSETADAILIYLKWRFEKELDQIRSSKSLAAYVQNNATKQAEEDILHESRPLFISEKSDTTSRAPMTRAGIGHILKHYESLIKRPLHPHMARASVATMLLNDNLSAHLVSEFMGWQSETMVRAYDKNLNKRVIKIDHALEGIF